MENMETQQDQAQKQGVKSKPAKPRCKYSAEPRDQGKSRTSREGWADLADQRLSEAIRYKRTIS